VLGGLNVEFLHAVSSPTPTLDREAGRAVGDRSGHSSHLLRAPSRHSSSLIATPFSFATELWHNRHLVWQFTVRNVELRHKGSHLGLIWSFLNPLLMLAIYVLVFGFIFRGKFQKTPEPRIEYALVVFLGLSIYHFLAEVIGSAPYVIVGNPNFVKKVVFPLEILPVSAVGGALFHFVISLALVFVGALLAGVSISSGVFWLPLIVLPVVLMSVGLSLLLSALGVFWRDISQIVQFLLLGLMFASAVFYPVEQIPPPAWAILKFNPLLLAIHESRAVTFWALPPYALHLVYLYGTSFATLAVGVLAFRRLRASFADVL
jgi:lipopolysaccharide transport system permease protein